MIVHMQTLISSTSWSVKKLLNAEEVNKLLNNGDWRVYGMHVGIAHTYVQTMYLGTLSLVTVFTTPTGS